MTIFGVLLISAIIWVFLYMHSKSDKTVFTENPQFKDSFFIIAHRGGSLEAPENTLAAFQNAYSSNPNVLFEMDIHYTKDKKIVVLHDETVDRTTNGKGLIKELNYDEVLKLDAGYNFLNEAGDSNYRNKNVKIPLLEEVFQKYPNTRMIVELKPFSQDLVDEVFNLLKKYNRLDKTIIGSRQSRNINYIRTLDKNILTSVTPDEMYRTLMLNNIGLAGMDKMPSYVFAIPEKQDSMMVLNKRLMLEAQRRFKKFFIWTVNEKADMLRLKEFGVNGLITDRPKLLLNLLNEESPKN